VSIFVLDASVVVKWLLPEIHSDAARRLLEQDHDYLAPDLLFAEATNVIWKRMRRGQIAPRHAQQLAMDLETVAVETVPCRSLANEAYLLAAATGQNPYDALYVALALRLDTQVITADERLVNALSLIPTVAPHVTSLQHFDAR